MAEVSHLYWHRGLFSAMTTEYLTYYQANRHPRSLHRHEMSCRVLRPTFGRQCLANIFTLDIERYKRQRKEGGVSEVTINRERAFLKHLFSMAVQWGKVSENLVKKVRLYREDNARTRFLTEAEETSVLACCSAHLTPLVIPRLPTGFRASELLSLTWQDIDFRQGIITVQAGYAKNGKARRVPMNNSLTMLLKSAKVSGAAGKRVFCSRAGTPYRSFHNAFESAVRAAGVEDFTF